MEKIRIEELSVGNWVRLENTPFLVIGINPPYVDLLGNGNRLRMCDIDSDDLTPIPLTPEILEKNGWQKIPYSDKIYTIEGENYSLVYYIEGNVADFRRESDRCSITCNYIHELQHAMRLAGIDKEIVL